MWLSTAYERESAYIAVHRYHRQQRGGYFDAFEAIAIAHGGRPHWGKMHTRGRRLPPRSATRASTTSCAVRDRVDPERRFGNPYLERVLGG